MLPHSGVCVSAVDKNTPPVCTACPASSSSSSSTAAADEIVVRPRLTLWYYCHSYESASVISKETERQRKMWMSCVDPIHKYNAAECIWTPRGFFPHRVILNTLRLFIQQQKKHIYKRKITQKHFFFWLSSIFSCKSRLQRVLCVASPGFFFSQHLNLEKHSFAMNIDIHSKSW